MLRLWHVNDTMWHVNGTNLLYKSHNNNNIQMPKIYSVNLTNILLKRQKIAL
jgi:hypothetical protein